MATTPNRAARRAPAAKKAAPKKAPAKKATAEAPARPSPLQERAARFAELRQRALDSGFTGIRYKPTEPLVIGEDKGFDPPLVIELPTALTLRMAAEKALNEGYMSEFLQLVLTTEQLTRILGALTGLPDEDYLLAGVFFLIRNHFYGPGAGDVPGGSQPS